MTAAQRLTQNWITRWLIMDAAHAVAGDPISRDVELLLTEGIALLCAFSGLDPKAAIDAASAELMSGIETAKCVRKAKAQA